MFQKFDKRTVLMHTQAPLTEQKESQMNLSQSDLNVGFSQYDKDDSLFSFMYRKTIWDRILGVCVISIIASTLGILMSFFLWL